MVGFGYGWGFLVPRNNETDRVVPAELSVTVG